MAHRPANGGPLPPPRHRPQVFVEGDTPEDLAARIRRTLAGLWS
jgi:hypothetical protein